MFFREIVSADMNEDSKKARRPHVLEAIINMHQAERVGQFKSPQANQDRQFCKMTMSELIKSKEPESVCLDFSMNDHSRAEQGGQDSESNSMDDSSVDVKERERQALEDQNKLFADPALYDHADRISTQLATKACRK